MTQRLCQVPGQNTSGTGSNSDFSVNGNMMNDSLVNGLEKS